MIGVSCFIFVCAGKENHVNRKISIEERKRAKNIKKSKFCNWKLIWLATYNYLLKLNVAANSSQSPQSTRPFIMNRKLSLFPILFCGFLFGCCQAKGEQVFAACNQFCVEFYFSTFCTPTLFQEFHREEVFVRLRLLLLFDDAISRVFALHFSLPIPFKRFF